MPLNDVLARIPGFAGWEAVKQNNAQADENQIQQYGQLQQILSRHQEAQKEQQFRRELAGARTDEERVAVAVRFSGAPGILSHADRQTAQKGVQENARARLTQALQVATLNHQDRMRSATTAEAKAAEQARHNGITEAIQRDAVSQSGSRLTYDTGMPASNSAAPEPATYNFQLPGGEMLSGTAPSEQQAIGIGQAALAPRVQPAAPTAAPAPVAAPSGPDPWATAPGVGAPAVAPAIPARPNNMDARDLRLQGGISPATPTATPVPTTAPVAPAVAPVAKPMPPEIARAPKRVQDAWALANAKQATGTGASEEVVRAIVEGRMQMPTGFALRSPYWQDVIERVAKQDPAFDASKYGARAAARRTFASGPEARNVTALNTVIGHLGTLDEAAAALDNKDFRAFNTVANRMAHELGDPRIVNFETAKHAVAEETMRVFRQVGASESEARMWGEKISAQGSPAQLRGTIGTLGTLLDSRVEAISQQYERTVKGDGNPARVDPANRTTLDRLIKGAAPASRGFDDADKERRYQEWKSRQPQ